MADIHRVKFEIAADDQATRIFKQVTGSMGMLRANWITLGAAISSGAILTGAISKAIMLRSALDDLADTTGDSVTTLDGLRRQAHISGVSLDELGTSLSRLARNLNSADDDGKAAGAAIQAIGLSVEELQAKKPGEALVEIAKALDRFGDGSAKVAVATALMGREGAKLLPYLKDLAESGELQGRITGEQAKAAEQLEKDWRKLTLAFEDAQTTIAQALIPGMVTLTESLQKSVREGEAFTGFLREAIKLATALGERLSIVPQALSEWVFQEGGEGAMGGARVGRIRGPTGEPLVPTTGRETLEFKIPEKEKRGEDIVSRQLEAAAEEEIRQMSEIAQLTDGYNAKLRERARLEEMWGDEVLGMTIEQMKNYNDQRLKSIDYMDEEAIRIGQLQAGFDGLGNSLEKVEKSSYNFGFTFNSALEDAIINGESLREVIQALGRDIARAFIRRAVTDPLSQALGGALGAAFSGLFTGGGGTLGSSSTSTIMAQHGADFTVGGSGGVDSQLVRFRATPGERVVVTPPGQSGGGIIINMHMGPFGSDVRRGELLAWGRQVEKSTLAAVAEATGRGGRYSTAVRG